MEATTIENLEKSVYAIKLGDSNYDESLKKAEEIKETGNKYLKEENNIEALNKFTQALDMNIETKKNAIYCSNRAYVHIKMENYGLALIDAQKAIDIDKDYIKAYYRRASANLILGKYDEAIEDLEFIQTKYPSEESLKDKLAKARAERKRKRFLEILASDRPDGTKPKSVIKAALDKVAVESSYSGAKLPEDGKIDKEWIISLMEDLKNEKFLHKKYLLQIMSTIRDFYEKQHSLIDIEIPDDHEFSVCGDVHGQYYDVMNIFKINGYPSETNPYLFNGDFVDRGSFSVEIMIAFFCWKYLYPNHFHLARGNHETKNLNRLYGFEGECKKKYDEEIYECFSELFCYLPLGHVLNKKVLVVHGGIFSQDGVTLDQIKNVDRFREPPEKGIMCEILWADPCKMNGRHPSKRGVGLSFGPDVAKRFLDENNLELLVRSHEVKDAGYEVEADGKVITIFSAPNYCDQVGNKGALIRFKGSEMKPNFVQFTAVDHPKVPPMKYANPWMMF